MKNALLADLKRSGLSAHDVPKLKFQVLTPKRTKELTRFEVASYLIPYFDVDGKKIQKFWRVRYLEEIPGKFGAKLKKPPRYTGPKNVLPRFYLAPSIAWRKIADDPTEPVIFTEGEKKAAKACKSGAPCISVPGVWAWRSKKKGIAAIPDFDEFVWKERKAYLCFDNDLMTNPLVIGALSALASELFRRGAVVIIKLLPKGRGKIGLDDYLCTHTLKQWYSLKQEEFSESAEVWDLNNEIAYITKLNSICKVDERVFYTTKQQLVSMAYANRTYAVPKANGEGFTIKNAAEEWLKWKHRRTYRDIVYSPGHDTIVGDNINLWNGFGVGPEPGNVKPFVALLDYVFDDEDELKTWFWQWLAYPIQNPGVKLFSAVLLHSPHQGVGKSFIGYIMGDIYGENFSVVSEEQVHSSFNDWCAHKQFILGEEMTGSEKRRDADRIKNMLTREQIVVNRKYEPVYSVTDCNNFLFTSNHVDAFILEDKDRRICVHEIRSPPRSDAWYKQIDTWRRNGGPAHLLSHLLTVDCTEFNPRAPAPLTASKTSMQNLSKTDLDIFVRDLRENPDNILRVGKMTAPADLMTTREVAAFLPSRYEHSLNGLGRALRRGGFLSPRPCLTKHGTQRLICVRNEKEWMRKTISQWARHWDKYHPKEKF